MSDHLGFKIERDELSERLGGGLPRGSLVVVEAPYGAGKSILTQRLLYGLLENHHSVGVVSTELTTLGFISQMNSLDYKVERHLLNGHLLYIPVYPLVSDRCVPADLLARLRHAGDLWNQEVAVIDTFSKLVADQGRTLASTHPSSDPLQAEAEETLYHIKRLTSIGKTVILTIEPGRMREDLLDLFRDASDVHLTLDFSLVGNTASRRIVVNRFSRAKGRFGDVVGYRVEPKVGLVIEIKSVA